MDMFDSKGLLTYYTYIYIYIAKIIFLCLSVCLSVRSPLPICSPKPVTSLNIVKLVYQIHHPLPSLPANVNKHLNKPTTLHWYDSERCRHRPIGFPLSRRRFISSLKCRAGFILWIYTPGKGGRRGGGDSEARGREQKKKPQIKIEQGTPYPDSELRPPSYCLPA